MCVCVSVSTNRRPLKTWARPCFRASRMQGSRPASSTANTAAIPSLVPNPAPHTLHPTTCTLHPTPYTLHPAPYTLHPTPYTLHPAPHTQHPAPYTLRPTSGIINPFKNTLCKLSRCHPVRGVASPPPPHVARTRTVNTSRCVRH